LFVSLHFFFVVLIAYPPHAWDDGAFQKILAKSHQHVWEKLVAQRDVFQNFCDVQTASVWKCCPHWAISKKLIRSAPSMCPCTGFFATSANINELLMSS
jgi:hypothetical protein